jgi:hypothetical protein
MAVPDTTTFSLQDVVNEVNPTTDDLVDCFADAVANKFDSNYNNDTYAPANSLLRFRNYQASLNSVYMSFYGTGDTFKCSADYDVVSINYTQGTGNEYEINDIVYEDADGNNIFQGGSLWYRMKTDINASDAGYIYKINYQGVIIDKQNC